MLPLLVVVVVLGVIGGCGLLMLVAVGGGGGGAWWCGNMLVVIIIAIVKAVRWIVVNLNLSNKKKLTIDLESPMVVVVKERRVVEKKLKLKNVLSSFQNPNHWHMTLFILEIGHQLRVAAAHLCWNHHNDNNDSDGPLT